MKMLLILLTLFTASYTIGLPTELKKTEENAPVGLPNKSADISKTTTPPGQNNEKLSRTKALSVFYLSSGLSTYGMLYLIDRLTQMRGCTPTPQKTLLYNATVPLGILTSSALLGCLFVSRGSNSFNRRPLPSLKSNKIDDAKRVTAGLIVGATSIASEVMDFAVRAMIALVSVPVIAGTGMYLSYKYIAPPTPRIFSLGIIGGIAAGASVLRKIIAKKKTNKETVSSPRKDYLEKAYS